MSKSYKRTEAQIFISSQYDYHKCKEVSNLWFCVSAMPTILDFPICLLAVLLFLVKP